MTSTRNIILVTTISICILAMAYFHFILHRDTKPLIIQVPNQQKKQRKEIRIDLTEKTTSDENVFFEDQKLILKEEAKYILTGTLEQGNIIVESKGIVELVLENAEITSHLYSPIDCKQAKKIKIRLAKDTKNILNSQSQPAIQSTSPIEIKGTGYLQTNSQEKGIYTKNASINISNGTLHLQTEEEGIYSGGDQSASMKLSPQSLYIESGQDGITSNKNIKIENGRIYIASRKTSIDCDDYLIITGGTIIGLGQTPVQELESKKTTRKYLSLNFSGMKENYLLLENEKAILAFSSNQEFKHLFLSTDLENKEYTLATIETPKEATEGYLPLEEMTIKSYIAIGNEDAFLPQ